MAQNPQIKGAEILDKVKEVGPCRDNIGWTAAYLTRKYRQGGTIVMERVGDVVTVRVNKRAVIEIVRGKDCSLRTAYYGSNKIVSKYTDKCPCDAIDTLVEGIKKLVMFGDEQLLEWIAEYLRPSAVQRAGTA
jgi:hypothetical protein